MPLRFGTDGVRGVANLELTPELVLALGRAAARLLVAPGARFVVGRDTRQSGPLLEAALVAGLLAEGVHVEALGVVPTPAVAWVASQENVAGAMISASHNPFPDNGVKLFAPGGLKLSDETEARLEAELDRLVHPPAGVGVGIESPATVAIPVGEQVGVVESGANQRAGYEQAVIDSIEGRTLAGLHVVVDTANGSASAVAPDVLRRLGARVDVIHDEPDGRNINDQCGSTHPDDLQQEVVARGAHAGLAFDGDADRVLAVDGQGQLVDGDQIIAVCAIDRHDRGCLPGATVVVTVMANLGFRHALRDHGIEIVETPVGDRYVLQALEEGKWALGGEQSGHVIFRDLATTGDGLLTGVQLLDVVARSGRSLAELAAVVTRVPQVLRNVRFDHRGVDISTVIGAELAEVEAELGDRGRVLVRPSGTEPVVRVMVEAPSAAEAESATARLVAVLERAISPGEARRIEPTAGS